MAPIKCPYCGAIISEEDDYCDKCGMRLKKYVHDDNPITPSIKGNRYEECIVIFNFCLGGLGILMFVAILLSKGGIYENRIPYIVSIGVMANAILNYGALKTKERVLVYLIAIPVMITFFGCLKGLSLAPAYMPLEIFIIVISFSTVWQLRKEKVI